VTKTELAEAVVAPAHDLPRSEQRAGMLGADRDRTSFRYAGHTRRQRAQAIAPVAARGWLTLESVATEIAPAFNGSCGRDGTSASGTRGQVDAVRQHPVRCRAPFFAADVEVSARKLPLVVLAPARNRAIGEQCAHVLGPRDDQERGASNRRCVRQGPASRAAGGGAIGWHTLAAGVDTATAG
jgi:hypothetical protein